MIARTGSDSARHQITSVTSPNVQIIAMPDPLSGSASSCALIGTRTPKSGVIDLGAEERLVALVVGMRDERDARRDQLGPRRLDRDRRRRRRGLRELDPVIRARLLAILELRLRDGRPEVDVPQRRRLDLVGVPLVQAAAGTTPARRAARGGRSSRRSSSQSTERPRYRHSASNAFSSSTVSLVQSSMKFGRETEIGCLPGFSGGWNAGS